MPKTLRGERQPGIHALLEPAPVFPKIKLRGIDDQD